MKEVAPILFAALIGTVVPAIISEQRRDSSLQIAKDPHDKVCMY